MEALRVRDAAGKAGRFEVIDNADTLYEVFRHLDATSLGKAACVSRKWRQATKEDTLWEAICTRTWPCTYSAAAALVLELKSLVVTLGGFKPLYVNCLYCYPFWLRPRLSGFDVLVKEARGLDEAKKAELRIFIREKIEKIAGNMEWWPISD